MTDTTELIQRLREHRGDYAEEMDEAADALEQQAAQIEALRADAERMRELLADANETLHGNYTVLMRLILTNPPGGRYSFFSARDGSMIEATGPINQTMTVIAALDAALRQEQPTKGEGDGSGN
jgi:hypothetical protein